MMKIESFGLSDVGRRREQNEDAFVVDEGTGLYAVADGMGGHAAGEVASRIAIDTLREAVSRNGWNAEGATPEAAAERLQAAVVEANQRILDTVRRREDWRGMGTTLVATLTAGDQAVVAHVGDSRAYLLREGMLRRLTNDHSWVHEQVRMGLLTEEDARTHPMRNIVTRAMGNRPDVRADMVREAVRPGDVFLLCSDGLNNMLRDEEIRDLLAAHRGLPERACRALVEAANERGGDDNITVLIVSVPEAPA